MTHTPILRENYLPADFLIETVELVFELHPTETRVRNTMHIQRNPQSVDPHAPLVLDGRHILLTAVYLNHHMLNEADYEVTDTTLSIPQVSEHFTVTVETICNPEANTELEGLYLSNGIFCTQCEPHGFQKITYYLDRPDVMAVFTTTIIADATQYPVLLSNGNLITEENLADGRYQVVWRDPFKKSSYLFALVAGKLDCLEDFFITQSNRKIVLRIFVEQGQAPKAMYAMEMLKRAMDFDEKVYGREYDLDIFMIVAVHDFNMGAMENKGLNIFNDKYILVDEDTATDEDFINVGVVVAHEYFHNWTGNRITCRDWFQLSLKEGLTVFRDQQFCGTLVTDAIARMDQVRFLKERQFSEDAGPLAHPVRPDQYVDMNNFYTVTVYHKGAELVRMLHVLQGEDNFRRGMDLYFERFDGMAVTCDDFVQAHADANKQDYTQFMRWYSQAGTPELTFSDTFNPRTSKFCLSVEQTIAVTADGSAKEHFHIPIHVALFDRETGEQKTELVIELTEQQQHFEFDDFAVKPVPSLLRNFSAPVKWNYPYTLEEMIFLLQYEDNLFNRFQIAQNIYMHYFNLDLNFLSNTEGASSYCKALNHILTDDALDTAIKARLLSAPTYNELAKLENKIQVEATIRIADHLNKEISAALALHALAQYLVLEKNATQNSMGDRKLKNTCLRILFRAEHPEAEILTLQLYHSAHNMTDRYNALSLLMIYGRAPTRQKALAEFYDRYQDNELVLCKWLALQAAIPEQSTLALVKKLLSHPRFDLKNPNKIYALLSTFAQNFVAFHWPDGFAYEFFAEQVLRIDQGNSIVAARLVEPLTQWNHYEDAHAVLMRSALQSIALTENISPGLREIVDKSL